MIKWIAVDWGTTHLRAYAMSDNNEVIAEAGSADGMGSLTPEAFEHALLALIDDWLPTDEAMTVLACGMVGARQGWTEAPYNSTPCEPLTLGQSIQVETKDARLNVHILPGISQAAPADVMRGEETQIAGLIADQTNAICTVCLPGTHSKWVSLKHGKVDHFTTSMTGEMFSLLSQQSILRHSTSQDGWNENAFLEGARASIDHPENLQSACFQLRARFLLDDFSPIMARARLSGLLIGAEIAGAKSYWKAESVAIVGDPALSKLYADALSLIEVDVKTFDPKTLTLAGLIHAHNRLTDSTDSQGN